VAIEVVESLDERPIRRAGIDGLMVLDRVGTLLEAVGDGGRGPLEMESALPAVSFAMFASAAPASSWKTMSIGKSSGQLRLSFWSCLNP
jgi:hypothetical protein